jgi:hypothetical protein
MFNHVNILPQCLICGSVWPRNRLASLKEEHIKKCSRDENLKIIVNSAIEKNSKGNLTFFIPAISPSPVRSPFRKPRKNNLQFY